VLTYTCPLLTTGWRAREEEPWRFTCRDSLCMCLDEQDLRKTLVQECWVGADIWSHSAQARIVHSTGVSKWQIWQWGVSSILFPRITSRRAVFLPYLAMQHNLFRCVTCFESGPPCLGGFQGFWDGSIVVEW
jgi:hypothetical protein